MNICAGIVTFNPDIDRLWQNLTAIDKQVKEVVIVDNGSRNVSQIEKIVRPNVKIILLKNNQNEGIAKALNRMILWAESRKYQWVLTLDQDSVCHDNLIEQYLPYTSDRKIGMLTCDIVDRNCHFKEKKKKNKFEYVKKCITSGCLTNVAACIDSGMFDEKLFIDSVDYDMCYSMREHGYQIGKVHFQGLLHEVGHSKGYSILGFEFAVTNHSAQRKYYISRNSTYLIKKHRLNKVKEYFIIYRRIATVLIFEQDKWNKCKAIVRGIRDGWRM